MELSKDEKALITGLRNLNIKPMFIVNNAMQSFITRDDEEMTESAKERLQSYIRIQKLIRDTY